MKLLWNLFLTFARIGGLTFGGGYAMLPMLQREVVEQNHWATEAELANYYAIGQCTPGIIAVNTATFIGYKLAGIWGGIFATLGVVAPSLVIITIIAACLENFADYAIVQAAFSGIRVCVCLLILQALRKLWKKSVIDRTTTGIFLVIFALAVCTNLSTIWLVIGAGLAGILLGAHQPKEGN